MDFKCNNDVDALLSVRCVTVMLQIARAHGQREGERGIGIIRNVGKRQQILVFVGGERHGVEKRGSIGVELLLIFEKVGILTRIISTYCNTFMCTPLFICLW